MPPAPCIFLTVLSTNRSEEPAVLKKKDTNPRARKFRYRPLYSPVYQCADSHIRPFVYPPVHIIFDFPVAMGCDGSWSDAVPQKGNSRGHGSSPQRCGLIPDIHRDISQTITRKPHPTNRGAPPPMPLEVLVIPITAQTPVLSDISRHQP